MNLRLRADFPSRSNAVETEENEENKENVGETAFRFIPPSQAEYFLLSSNPPWFSFQPNISYPAKTRKDAAITAIKAGATENCCRICNFGIAEKNSLHRIRLSSPSQVL